MKMPFVNMCCCANLRTGGFIIGWLGTIDALLRGCGAVVFSVFAFSNESLAHIDITSRASLCALSVAFAGLCLVASIMLLVGTSKKNHLFVLPWLTMNGLSTFGGLIAILISGGVLLSFGDMFPYYQAAGASMLIFGIPLSCLSIYFWICILSLYQSLRNEKANNNFNTMH